jgi:hypothetical protein
MKTLEIEVIAGRDLVAEFKCDCPHDKYPTLLNRTIKLYGYNDANFFDNVNKEPRLYKCKCGKEYKYRWTREGVNVEAV